MGRVKQAIVALVVAGSFVIGTTPAHATTTVKTKFADVTSYGIEGVDDVSSVDGHLKSKKAKCIVGRTVYVFWWNGSMWVTYGSDVTDATGYFVVSGSGPYNGTTYGLRASKLKLGNTVCKGAVVTGRFDT